MSESIEIAKLKEQVKLYRFDYVTGLRQRHDFERDARKYWAEGFRLSMHDIDGLKHVNDTQGHAAGDSLIRQVANDLRMLDSACSVYRVGGDEFMTIHDSACESVNIRVDNTSSASVNTKNYTTLNDAVDAVDKLMYIDKRKLKRRGDDD